MVASHSSSVAETNIRSRTMPALLTMTCSPPNAVDRGIDDALGRIPVGNVLVIGDRLAAGGDDLRHHGIGSAGVAAFAGQRGADIVDDDVGAFGGKGQRIGAAQPAGGAGDDDGAVVTNAHSLSQGLKRVGAAVADEVGLHIFARGEVPAGTIAGQRVAVTAGGDDLQRIARCRLEHGPLALAGRALAIGASSMIGLVVMWRVSGLPS